MKSNWLIATAAVAILASTGFAAAQMIDRGEKPPGATEKRVPSSPSQMQNNGTSKGEPAMPRGAQQGGQTTGQAPQHPQQQKQKNTDTKTRSETTGKGDAQGASLGTEQRARIREAVINTRIPKVDKVDFSITIGATVPRTVRFQPIPVEIVQIHPAWRGYRVVLVGTELLIIHPRTFEIVAIIVV